MNVTQAGRVLGVSPRTLRHYEAEGLLAPARSENGYRRYSPREIERAEWVRDFIAAGFSARELRDILDYPSDARSREAMDCGAIMRNKLDQIEKLTATLLTRKRNLSQRLHNWEHQQHQCKGGKQ